MFDFLKKFWQSLIEKFTIQNPVIYRISVFVLSVSASVLAFGTEFGVWVETPFWAKVSAGITWALALLIQDGEAKKSPG